MSVNIRKAIEKDRYNIANIFADAFYEDWKRLHEDVAVIANVLADGIQINHYYVAEIDDKTVGFIAGVEKEERAFSVSIRSFKKHFGLVKGYMIGMSLKGEFNQPLNLSKDTAYIDILGVGKHAQGKGVGTQLLHYLIKEIDKKCYLLTVTNINEKAIHCYKKNGFVEYDRKSVKFAKQKGFSEMLYMRLENE